MHTPSHMLMGAAIYGARRPRLVWAALLGGVAPDVPMFVMFAAAQLAGADAHYVFEEAYFSNGWQVANGLGHSFLLWPLLLVGGMFLRRRNSGAWLTAFAASGFTHAVVDFLCHREDAHMHFWPLSRWRFMSPVSYYERAHFGGWFMIAETGLSLGFAVWLIWRVRHWPTRLMLGLLAIPYLLVTALFVAHGSHL